MKILRSKIFCTVGFYVWLLSLFILTSVAFPNKINPEKEMALRWDYFEHFFLYLIIPILYFLAEGAFLQKFIKNNYLILFLGLAFSGFTEAQQIYIEGRAFNPVDLILNVGGFLAGIPIGKFLSKRLNKR